MDEFVSTLNEVMMQPATLEALFIAACTFLLATIGSLWYDHHHLSQRFRKAEADLLDRTVGTHSRNWTTAARSLETKAKEPGEVARSVSITYLCMLNEAAEAWLKGGQWQDSLRVSQKLLIESAHSIGWPGLSDKEFHTIADLVQARLSTYPDLSKAADEATENALKFLAELDADLAVLNYSERIMQLRDQVSNTRAAIESKASDAKAKTR